MRSVHYRILRSHKDTPHGLNGKNFIKTMINVGKTHDEVRVVNDQIGNPTYTYDLARLLVDMCETEKYGYYHATNAEIPDENAGCSKPISEGSTAVSDRGLERKTDSRDKDGTDKS